MYKTGIVGLAFVVSLAVSARDVLAEEPKQENKLIGTWKLVSGNLPDGFTEVKHVTPAQFMWALYDKDGKVVNALGGSYKLKGDTYEEVPEYGVGEGILARGPQGKDAILQMENRGEQVAPYGHVEHRASHRGGMGTCRKEVSFINRFGSCSRRWGVSGV